MLISSPQALHRSYRCVTLTHFQGHMSGGVVMTAAGRGRGAVWGVRIMTLQFVINAKQDTYCQQVGKQIETHKRLNSFFFFLTRQIHVKPCQTEQAVHIFDVLCVLICYESSFRIPFVLGVDFNLLDSFVTLS